jgi:hypothetical protein
MLPFHQRPPLVFFLVPAAAVCSSSLPLPSPLLSTLPRQRIDFALLPSAFGWLVRHGDDDAAAGLRAGGAGPAQLRRRVPLPPRQVPRTPRRAPRLHRSQGAACLASLPSFFVFISSTLNFTQLNSSTSTKSILSSDILCSRLLRY